MVPFYIFVFCIGLLIYHYLGFPFLLRILTKGKSQNDMAWSETDNLPDIAIMMAAYNEETVIEAKIQSILETTYPSNKLKVFIGSDASTDLTNSIINKYSQKHSSIHFFKFTERTGKPKIIDQMMHDVDAQLLVMTDANVIFRKDTLYELVKYFKNEQVGLVGGNIQNFRTKRDGISHQEKQYLSLENQIKYQEGILWGTMMGAFGGVFSMRKSLYEPIPVNFIVDDFYTTFKVLENGYQAINNLNAITYEDVSNKMMTEFKRKKRIASGNFQNLNHFKKHLLRPFRAIGFCFLSHKVLRWLGPFWLLGTLVSNVFLARESIFWQLCLFAQISFYLIPLVDVIFGKFNKNLKLMRFISHWLAMNIALFLGFVAYIKGIKSNVWVPTERHQ